MPVNAISFQWSKKQGQLSQTALVNAVIHLFVQGFNPTPSNVAADFAAQEATFDGYAAITTATWPGLGLGPGSGYILYPATETFSWVSAGPNVGNNIGGYWIEDATGLVVQYQIFDNPVPMTGPGNILPVSPIQFFPTGP